MNRQLALVGTLLRKDLRLFWQFAALVAVFLALRQIPAAVAMLGPLAGLLQLAIPLSTILLIMVVCYEDAVVSVKHDWLTRPIPGAALLLAKFVFVLAAIVLPSILGSIANNLRDGRSVGEALLAGASTGAQGSTLIVIGVVMAFAAVTAGIRQAFIVLLAGFVIMGVVILLVIRVSGVDEAIGMSGSSWVVGTPVQLTLLFVIAAVLWVQYRHRHTKAARVIVGVAVIAGTMFIATMTWPRISAVQRMLSPDPAAADLVQVQVANGCFPTRVLEADRSVATVGAAAGIRPEFYPEEQRQRAGADAVAFSTSLVRESIPVGGRLSIGRVALTYHNAGAAIRPLRPGRMSAQWRSNESGLLVADHYWLLSRSQYASLAAHAGVEARIDYSLSLLAPTAEAAFVADGQRSFYPGIGYCSAKFDRATAVVDVNCFKAGAQPAQLVANLSGAPESGSRASGFPDFKPAIFDFWGGNQHSMQLHAKGVDVPRVTVTAYRARAHFDRQIVVPGVLGGPVSACPAP